jgi:hypothetical protein
MAEARAGRRGYRTVLHGRCLVDGKHAPGSPWARECPVLRRQRKQAIFSPKTEGLPTLGQGVFLKPFHVVASV